MPAVVVVVGEVAGNVLPGQAAVLYEDDAVVGAGVISPNIDA